MDRALASPPHSAPSNTHRRARAAAPLALAAVAGIALASQAWIVALPFQLDDHLLLLDPADLFHSTSRFAERAVGAPEPTMLRWTLWGVWTALAALCGTPLSPLLFHAVGLALHIACCVLVALCTTRLLGARVSPQRPWLPGLVAGAGMALSTGAIEAVSWTSAWGDSLALLFACAALLALLRAGGRSRGVWLAIGGLLALLSLLSKESAIVLPLVLALALLAFRGDTRPRAECGVLAAALALFLLLRVLFLGGLHLSAGSATPNAVELAQRARPVLRGFVQALHPHNDAPEFADLAPFVARWHADTLVYFAWGLPVAIALFASRRGPRAGALALTALALVLAPTALIATGAPTNVLSRAEYAPLALVWLLWGGALVQLWNLGGPRANALRALAAACVAVQLAAAFDLRAHVVATEQLAAARITALDRCVEEARAEHARSGQRLPLTIVYIAGEPGLGGIPLVGEHARFRYAPPFAPGVVDRAQLRRTRAQGGGPAYAASGGTRAADDGALGTDAATHATTALALADTAAPDFEVRAWGTRGECERDWPSAELAARDLVWIDASGDVLALRARGASGPELRAAALPRARAPLVQGFAPARRKGLAFRSEPAPQSAQQSPGQSTQSTTRSPAQAPPRPDSRPSPTSELRYVPSALIPAHSLGALELAFAPGPAVELELVLESGKQRARHAFTLRATEQELRRVALAPTPSLARVFGPPIHAFAIGIAPARAGSTAESRSSGGSTSTDGSQSSAGSPSTDISLPTSAAPPLPALVYEPKLLEQLPPVELVEPAAQSALALDPMRPPRVVLARAPSSGVELELRLEIALQLPIGRVAIVATAPATALQSVASEVGAATRGVSAELRAFRFDAWPAELLSVPWSDFCAHVLEPELARRGREQVAAAARLVVAVRGSELVAGASEWRAIVLRR